MKDTRVTIQLADESGISAASQVRTGTSDGFTSAVPGGVAERESTFVAVTVSDRESIDRTIAAIRQAFGGAPRGPSDAESRTAI